MLKRTFTPRLLQEGGDDELLRWASTSMSLSMISKYPSLKTILLTLILVLYMVHQVDMRW